MALRCSAVCRTRATVVVGAAIGCLVMIGGSSMYMFNAYSQALKQQRQYRQTELDLVASLSNFGACVAPPGGYAIDYAGIVPTMIIGTILSTGGYLLAWAGTVGHFAMSGVLLAVFYLILSQGMSFVYLAALMVNMRNANEKYRGAIVALMETLYGVGCVGIRSFALPAAVAAAALTAAAPRASPAIFSVIYGALFGGASLPPPEQDLDGFLLFVSLFTLVCFVVGTVGLRYTPLAKSEHAAYIAEKRAARKLARERRRQQKLARLDAKAEAAEAEAGESAVASPPTSPLVAPTAIAAATAAVAADDESLGLLRAVASHTDLPAPLADERPAVGGVAVLRKPNFWLMFVLYVLATSVCTMFMSNLAFVLAAGGQDDVVNTHAILLPIASGVGRIIGGVFSDVTLRRRGVRRTTYLLVASVLTTVACPVLSFCVASPAAMYFATSAIGLATGLYWVLGSVLMAEEFGISTVGQNWSYMLLSSALGGLLFNWFAAELYDANADAAGECLGNACFRDTFMICLGAMVVSMIVNVVLYRRLAVPKWAAVRSSQKRRDSAGGLVASESAATLADVQVVEGLGADATT